MQLTYQKLMMDGILRETDIAYAFGHSLGEYSGIDS